ncbi:hypothetical protein MA594_002146, partial [Neisseria gonorrhoeae]
TVWRGKKVELNPAKWDWVKNTGYETTVTRKTLDGQIAGKNKPIKPSSGDYVLPVGRQIIDPTRTSFSQATVSYQKRGANYNYDSLVAAMNEKNHGLATGLMLLICLMEHLLVWITRVLWQHVKQG